MKEEIVIIPTKWGLASRVGNKVYISKDINKKSMLYKQLIKHELEHTSGFKLKDILLDLQGKHLGEVKGQYYLFLFTHPKTWSMYFPIWKYEKDWTIDYTLTFVYLIFILLGVYLM